MLLSKAKCFSENRITPEYFTVFLTGNLRSLIRITMVSIVLSFVGNQDPYSNQTQEEGSIITLLKFLASHPVTIRKVVLLHTEGTAQNAQDTRDYIISEAKFTDLNVELIPTSRELSNDPTDLLLAAQEAKRGLEQVKSQLEPGDRLEFNASSGTPAMKSAFSLLQAAGYAGNSQVWQVRNPEKMRPNQSRVFATDVLVLRQEFDRKRIEQQITDYNYSGAILEVAASGLGNDRLNGLLEYARCRKAFDFQGASAAIQPLAGQIADRWLHEIDQLCQGSKPALLAEVYFNAVLAIKNRDYYTFFTRVFGLQENVLKYFVAQIAPLPTAKHQTAEFWRAVQDFENGRVYQVLAQKAQSREEIRMIYFPNRPTMLEMLRCFDHHQDLVQTLEALEGLCGDRNRLVHEFKGISQLDDPAEILRQLRFILKDIVEISRTDHPFNALNADMQATLPS